MKRKDFLKRLGMGLGVAIVAPKVLTEMRGKEEIPTDKFQVPTHDMNVELLSQDIFNILRQTGHIIYKPRRISTNIRVSDVFGNTL